MNRQALPQTDLGCLKTKQNKKQKLEQIPNVVTKD